jgi:hypothetical protein
VVADRDQAANEAAAALSELPRWPLPLTVGTLREASSAHRSTAIGSRGNDLLDRRREGRWKVSIGVGIFLTVLGAIIALATEATTPGINVNVLGVILLLVGLVVVLSPLVLGSSLAPWGRRRVVVRRRTVVEQRPVEVVEERPLDDGLT